MLLEQDDGVIPPVLRKVGTSPEEIRRVVNAALDDLPTITAGAREPGNARELLDVLRAAEREAGKLRDEYISTEHLLLALSEAPGAAGTALPRHDVLRRRPSRRCAARTASPPRTPRTTSRRSRSSAAT